MIRRKKTKLPETKFHRVSEMMINNRLLSAGDLIKIQGEHGGKFKFHSLVTNKETGVQWIDCFEMHKVTASAWRSFRSDRIKLIPIKRGRRNVN